MGALQAAIVAACGSRIGGQLACGLAETPEVVLQFLIMGVVFRLFYRRALPRGVVLALVLGIALRLCMWPWRGVTMGPSVFAYDLLPDWLGMILELPSFLVFCTVGYALVAKAMFSALDNDHGAQPKGVEMSASKAKPNIIVFFTDQQRWDTVGCYGQEMNTTPNLDRMAAEGVRFESAFTCQPVCGPARASLQTGKYAAELGCFRNGIALPLGEKTLAHWLSEAGYEVGYIGKWHLASTGGLPTGNVDHRTKPIPPPYRGGYKDFWLASDVLEHTSHGYDGHLFDGDMKQVDFKGYRVDCQTDFALDYLRTRDGKRPFFLFLSYLEPHHQNDHNHFEGPIGSKEKFKDFKVPGDLDGLPGDWREEYPDYLGSIHCLDVNLGRIRAELEKMGIADKTVILFTSDHGCHFRTRNSEYKRACHEGCIRIPMVAWGPGFGGGKVVRELVSLVDVPPTILASAGIATPATMKGRALQGLLDGSARDWPEEVFLQISESHVGRAIRTRRWKYSVRAPGKAGGKDAGSDLYVEDFLYDLESDPHERRNLVSDPAYADVRKGLAETLIRRMVHAGEAAPRIEPAP